MDSQYVKLSDLVGQTITINSIAPPTYKMWDQGAKKMVVSQTPAKGFRKIYQVETDRGKVDMSASQIGQILEGHLQNGIADINGAVVEIRSNGQTGIDIRYFLNPVFQDQQEPLPPEPM